MKRTVVIILIAALLLAIAGLVLRASHGREWQAKGRVRLERGPIELSQTNSYDPYFLQTHFEIISNLLSSPESLKELERRTELKSSEFRFWVLMCFEAPGWLICISLGPTATA